MADEREAMALLCEHLPELRERAEAGYWADRLDMHLNEVAGGASALAACQELGLIGDDPTLRSGGRLDGLPAVTMTGDYRCPDRRCARRAGRDSNGRPPLCGLAETPMVFQTRR
jgi:hypothetical protein